MYSFLAAVILLFGTNYRVEGTKEHHWGSDQVQQVRHQQGGSGRQGVGQGGGEQYAVRDNIDLGARARAAHRSGKCKLLSVSNAPVVCSVQVSVVGFL